MSVQATADILAATWGLERGAKLLHVGSGAGHMVAALRALGFDATGVECSRAASLATPAELRKYNLYRDIASLPFEDGEFDAVIETALCRAAPNDVDNVIAEIRRVTRRGVLLGFRHDGPRDRSDRTLQPARGRSAPLLALGLV